MIDTERLHLRPFAAGDADDLFAIFSRPEVAQWSGAGVPMAHRDEAVARIERMPERAGSHPAAGVFAVVEHGVVEGSVVEQGVDRVVGMALLVPIPSSGSGERNDYEIGWHLHPDVWGRGYATEAASALVDRAWAAGLPDLVAVTDPDNEPSQRVCRRLGMADLGLRDDWYDRSLRAFRLAPS